MKIFYYIFFFTTLILIGSCNNDSADVENTKEKKVINSVSQLIMPKDQLLKLNRIRAEATEVGVVLSSSKNVVQGKWLVNQDTFKVEIKLISDYNNLQNVFQDSYRIKIKNGNYHGVRVLNLYSKDNFDQRHFFTQYLSRNLGILAPRSGIVSIDFDSSVKEYVWEEHFEKQLLESQNCREAPILRFDIRPYKELLAKEKEIGSRFYSELFLNSDILPFSRKKIRSNENLNLQFLNGRSLLNQLRNGEYTNLNDLVDLNKLASFYVLKDFVMGKDVPIPWYNLRYSYNPTTAKLEPIVYALEVSSSKSQVINESLRFESNLRSDDEFSKEYLSVQAKLSDDFLKDIIKSYNNKFENSSINKDSKEAVFSLSLFKRKIEKSIAEGVDTTIDLYEPILSLGLKITDLGENKLLLTNLHSQTLEILGSGIESGIILSSVKTVLPKAQIPFSTIHDIIYYRVKGRHTVYQASFFQTQIMEKSIGQIIREKAKIPDGFKQLGDSLIYVGQNKIYKSDVIIPEGYRVFFSKGSVMELEDCSFLSFSPVFANGTNENPILFYSNNANGFTVIDANITSEFTYVTFNKFGNQQFEGWTLPGAITFNNSDVTFSNCTFSNNTCEDALNIVRADFIVENCVFDNTFGDAFDADFCTGKVVKTNFNKIGNDAMDFSGSTIEIMDCKVISCGDKGISSGENSSLIISNVSISGAVIGIASKDLSKVTVTNLSTNNCERNFAVFKKKKEYGPAEIHAEGKNILSGKLNNIIDKNSILILNGVEIIGEESIDVDALYK